MSEFNQARREGKIKFGYDFNTLAEVTHLWGLPAAKLPYNVSFKIPGSENAVCLLLSEYGRDGWRDIPHRGTKMDGRGWREIVSIDEYNADVMISDLHVHDELAKPLERYVFWLESRDGVQWYKFYGVFEIDEGATRAALDRGEYVCIYRRKFEEGACPKCDERMESASPAEGIVLEGKILEATLLDRVACEFRTDGKRLDEKEVWPGQRFWVKEVSDSASCLFCQTSDEDVLPNARPREAAIFKIPRRDLELGYFKVVGDGRLDDTKNGGKPAEVDIVDWGGVVPAVSADKEFGKFWQEFTKWWKVSENEEDENEEEMSFKIGKMEYRLRCGWTEGTLVAAMISPWFREWDYVQLYAGMFGWADIGTGFHVTTLRKKVVRLLLDEIIRRKRWMLLHHGAVSERNRDIEALRADEQQSPRWFEEYRWIRNRMATVGEGDMRLYVKGVNRLFSTPIMCQWAIRD